MTSKFLTLLNSSLLAVGVTASSVLLGWQTSALAASLTFSGTGTNGNSGNPLSAEVTFDDMINPGNLTVTLTNLNGASVPSDVLTGLFWDITGDPALLLNSATAANVISQPTNLTNVNLQSAPRQGITGGGSGPRVEWGFAFNSSGLGGGSVSTQVTQHYGLGTAGFGISPSFNLTGGQQFNYGIIAQKNANANPQVSGGTFVDDSAVFVLSIPLNFDLNAIQNVRFQYGTALGEPSFPGEEIPPEEPEVPEPSTMAGLAFFLGGLMLTRKRKSYSNNL